jgi:kinesin family protein 6/9
VSPERKRRRYINANEEINELSWTWFKDATARRINVTGPLLQEKALKFARELGNDTFKVIHKINQFTSQFFKCLLTINV